MPTISRRNFLQLTGLGFTPALAQNSTLPNFKKPGKVNGPMIKFYGDGEMFEPGDYLAALEKAHDATAIIRDRYGAGGVVEALEKKFCEITGKEQAVFMPSGTMANQLAIATLSGSNSKVFVQDESHVYRDEADAAQTVFNKRLIGLAKGEPYFTATQLQNAVQSLQQDEVFPTGIGAVSIENPVRRMNGRMVPFEELKQISTYCREKKIPLHIDGARIYMASAWTGHSVKDFASLCDSFYVSLYKYLGASAGAILCGEKALIGQMPHLIKIHGGSMYSNWTNAAMALYRLEGIESRLKDVVKRSRELFERLNKIDGIKINSLEGGTNIFRMTLDKKINGAKMHQRMREEFNIQFQRPNDFHESFLTVNETMLYQDNDFLVKAFGDSIS
ncbi:MAG TPA: aminotransferase class I/II-fold pyridoxal phosphate-dependent enzyme [Flavitalea sp.]|nr:aminotransferase class I/II-fold pyridoxal phosphate-dependent enzyme [Flavitalea sp.]